MTIRLAVIVAAAAGICCAMPVGAEEVGRCWARWRNRRVRPP